MSVSSFHEHFKALTSMTPLQYQKQLRLIEARRLILAGELSVSGAAYRVGYESASQFSREYSRMFGGAPRLDVVASRGGGAGAGSVARGRGSAGEHGAVAEALAERPAAAQAPTAQTSAAREGKAAAV